MRRTVTCWQAVRVVQHPSRTLNCTRTLAHAPTRSLTTLPPLPHMCARRGGRGGKLRSDCSVISLNWIALKIHSHTTYKSRTNHVQIKYQIRKNTHECQLLTQSQIVVSLLFIACQSVSQEINAIIRSQFDNQVAGKRAAQHVLVA